MHDAKLSTIETRIRTLTTTIIGFDDLRNSGENNSAVKNLEYIGRGVAAGFELAELVLKNMKFLCPEAPKKYSPWGWIKADALVHSYERELRAARHST